MSKIGRILNLVWTFQDPVSRRHAKPKARRLIRTSTTRTLQHAHTNPDLFRSVKLQEAIRITAPTFLDIRLRPRAKVFIDECSGAGEPHLRKSHHFHVSAFSVPENRSTCVRPKTIRSTQAQKRALPTTKAIAGWRGTFETRVGGLAGYSTSVLAGMVTAEIRESAICDRFLANANVQASMSTRVDGQIAPVLEKSSALGKSDARFVKKR
jgi:hypothetical protein